MREVKAAGKKILWVGGPAVVHTGAAPHVIRLIEMGYVDLIFSGNALAWSPAVDLQIALDILDRYL